MKKTVLLLGNMEASKRVFELLKKELERVGFEITSYLSAGRLENEVFGTLGEALPHWIEEHSVLIAGMSSDEELSRCELIAIKSALEKNIPVFLYADTYNSWNRKWYHPFMEKVTGIFVLNEQEVQKGKRVFPKANFIATGNPLQEDYFFPKMTREEVRDHFGINEKSYVVLALGGKDPAINIIHFGATLEACYNIPSLKEKNITLLLGIHPGDQTPMDVYKSIWKFGGNENIQIIPVQKKEIPTSDLLPGCDLVVSLACSIGDEACCLRIPVIDFFPIITSARLEEAIGTSDWPPCSLGITTLAQDSSELHNLIVFASIGAKGFHDPMRRKQEEVFPKPLEKGSAVKKMVDAVKRMF